MPRAASGSVRRAVADAPGGRSPRPSAGGARRIYSILRRSVRGRLPALEHRGVPVVADDARALHPGAQLGLGELAVFFLELDAVAVARLQVLDQHLSRDLVLAAVGDVEVSLQERDRIADQNGKKAILDK